MQSQMILTVGLVGAMIIATTAAPAQAQPRRWWESAWRRPAACSWL